MLAGTGTPHLGGPFASQDGGLSGRIGLDHEMTIPIYRYSKIRMTQLLSY